MEQLHHGPVFIGWFSLILLIILATAQAASTVEPIGAITPDNPATVQAGIVAAFRAGCLTITAERGDSITSGSGRTESEKRRAEGSPWV